MLFSRYAALIMYKCVGSRILLYNYAQWLLTSTTHILSIHIAFSIINAWSWLPSRSRALILIWMRIRLLDHLDGLDKFHSVICFHTALSHLDTCRRLAHSMVAAPTKALKSQPFHNLEDSYQTRQVSANLHLDLALYIIAHCIMSTTYRENQRGPSPIPSLGLGQATARTITQKQQKMIHLFFFIWLAIYPAAMLRQH